jgi:hypothetical protein
MEGPGMLFTPLQESGAGVKVVVTVASVKPAEGAV